MLFANLDVSSHVLTWLVTLLAENEDQQRKLRDEIRNKGVNKNMSLNDYCNSKDTFLRACYLESLRLRPFTGWVIYNAGVLTKAYIG